MDKLVEITLGWSTELQRVVGITCIRDNGDGTVDASIVDIDLETMRYVPARSVVPFRAPEDIAVAPPVEKISSEEFAAKLNIEECGNCHCQNCICK